MLAVISRVPGERWRSCTHLLQALALLLIALSAPVMSAPGDRSPRPNILLIVADDLGYADLGSYGSDIHTPNIDGIASQGVVFTQFHTSPMCAPTRAMLLSGNNNHVAGVASQQQQGLLGHAFPGYEGGLSERIAPLPRLLQDAGYHTSIAGKWHLGDSREQSPMAAGFSRSWALLAGGGSHFDGTGFENAPSTYWADDDYTDYPEGNYSTAWYTDQLMAFIDEAHRDGKPFFTMAAYTAPHWPLQVPDEFLDRYRGRYDEGYEQLRERRFAALKAAGIVAPESILPPRNPDTTPWSELSAERQRRESRKMELYAAMVENLDHHIGRLISHLKTRGLHEDTLIVFMADNGAAGEDFYNTGPFVDYLRAHYDNRYALMGTRRSFVSYGPAWAEAGSAPFSRYKTFTYQGGIVAPMIMAGPGIPRRGAIDHSYVTVMDLAPTILDVAGAEYPPSEELAPMLGESLLPYFRGEHDAVHDDRYLTVLYHRGHALLRRGPWKLVSSEPPFDEAKFQLFNVVEDPGEVRDLRLHEPDLFAELKALWGTERRRLGIVLPEDL